MKVVWIGGIFSDEALARYRAVNQAQNRWSLGLTRELGKLGWKISCLAHRAERYWPRGKVFPGRPDDFHASVKPLMVPIINLPGLRNRHMRKAYRSRFIRYVSEHGNPELIVTYNPLPWHVPVAEYAVSELGIPWISITLDMKYPGEAMEHFSTLNRQAAGQVILSWWGYQNCPLSPKLHLDGGFERIHADEADYSPDSPRVILYSGKYSDYGGDQLLLDIIRNDPNPNHRYWLLGKGDNPQIEKLGRQDKRVKRFGFVNEAQLDELCRKAHIFLNPRPTAFADNLMTFPSKLLFYLSFGKPVVSTFTPGIAPEFKDHLYVPNDETHEGFLAEIDVATSKTQAELMRKRDSIIDFLQHSKSWETQASRFNSFCTDLINWNYFEEIN